MKGGASVMRVVFFATTLIFSLWLGVEYSAAQCPTATLLPSEVLPSIDDNVVTDQLGEQIATLQRAIPVLFQRRQVDVYAMAVVYRNSTIFLTGLVDTPFRIASITKVFVAMGALMLRQRGRLTLDDPVKKFLPKFSVINPYEDFGQDEHDITLRELMGHLSGLPRDLCPTIMCESESNEDEILQLIAKMQLARPPWSFLPSYSNLGFAILGHAWEKATSPRQSWDEFIRDEIATPLKMHQTGVDMANVKLAPGSLGEYPSNTTRGWKGPEGEMYSTALDLAEFLKFLLHPGHPKLLSASAIREWTHPTTVFSDVPGTGFALPWELGRIITSANQTTTVVTKNGGLGTYRSLMAFHPGSQLGVAVLTSINDTLNANMTSAGDRNLALALAYLIPPVQSIHANLISSRYSGVYKCKPSPAPFMSRHQANVTIQVLGGTVDVPAMAPGKALVANYNITLTLNGQETTTLVALASLVPKPGPPEDSFWAYGYSCLGIAGSLSANPEIKHPNFPGSVYLRELRFSPAEKRVFLPSIGGECYMSS